ncbi:MAG: tripartite tricarboxylate transporter TctB family protein [Phyllobacterium sp.]
MLSRNLLHRDFLSGVVFFAIGLTAFVAGNRYDVGTASDMGPGYFPALLGLLLIAFGGISVSAALRSSEVDKPDWIGLKPFMAIITSVIVFALLLEHVGLVLSILFCLLIACWDMIRRKPLQFAALYISLTAFCVGVFIYAFGMTIPLFW